MAKLKIISAIAFALAAIIAAPASADAHGYRYGPTYPAWSYVQYGCAPCQGGVFQWV